MRFWLLRLNPLQNINDNSVFQNGMLTHHGLVDSYEAGSVLKPLVVASALNEGLFTPDTLIDCHGDIGESMALVFEMTIPKIS